MLIYFIIISISLLIVACLYKVDVARRNRQRMLTILDDYIHLPEDNIFYQNSGLNTDYRFAHNPILTHEVIYARELNGKTDVLEVHFQYNARTRKYCGNLEMRHQHVSVATCSSSYLARLFYSPYLHIVAEVELLNSLPLEEFNINSHKEYAMALEIIKKKLHHTYRYSAKDKNN